MKKTYILLPLSILLFACMPSTLAIPSPTPSSAPVTVTTAPSLTVAPSPSITSTPTPTPIPTRGEATLLNGFAHYAESGFEFASAEVVGWDSNRADVLAGSEPIRFFFQFDAPPYNDPALDKDARSGGIRMSQTDLAEIKECPQAGYQHHWFTVKLDATYCLQTRDGEHYAKVQVTSITEEQITFTWVYQPNGTRQFED